MSFSRLVSTIALKNLHVKISVRYCRKTGIGFVFFDNDSDDLVDYFHGQGGKWRQRWIATVLAKFDGYEQ